MSHDLGPVIADGRSIDQDTPVDFEPGTGATPVRFVMLHFTSLSLSPGARLEVDLHHGTDVFSKESGPDVWTRPADPAKGPIAVRIVGGSGSAVLAEYGRATPSIVPDAADGGPAESNPDLFVQDGTYQEPTYETRLNCSGTINTDPVWTNTRELTSGNVEHAAARACGIVVLAHGGHVSSCSGTLIGSDLFLTSRHCFTEPDGSDVASASVTFDYEVDDAGMPATPHEPRFHKVRGEVLRGTSADPADQRDWVILQLESPAPADREPRQIRVAGPMIGESVFAVHHAYGAAKKFQAGTLTSTTTVTGFDWAGGSSGSALFDSSGRIVWAPLSWGSGCTVNYPDPAYIRERLIDPGEPPQPFDVMMVFDRSGSMNQIAPPAGRTKLEEARDAAALFVELVRAGGGDRIGLATFNDEAALPVAPGPVASVRDDLIGPPPHTGPTVDGAIGDIAAGGTTSMGAGMDEAVEALPAATGNQRAMLLLSDGLENTPPMVDTVEPTLGDMRVCVVGFGSDAEIDSPLLGRLAADHDGLFTRATDGLTLRKFFALCFGDIFAAGALSDPDYVLPRDQKSREISFDVCDETSLAVVIGWQDPSVPLALAVRTPDGHSASECPGVEESSGRTWRFLRIPLPCHGEREGRWTVEVMRVRSGGEFTPAPQDVRFFLLVVPSGGPEIRALGPRRVYTGDAINPRVRLAYADGRAPRGQVKLTVDAPDRALGELALAHSVGPQVDGDAVPPFRASLQAAASAAGGSLPVPRREHSYELFDDGEHGDGALERDGVFGLEIEDLIRHEGTYEFHAVASYEGRGGCTGRREALWSVAVVCGIDPERSDIDLRNERPSSGGRRRGDLAVFPRDRFGNALGPGRSNELSVAPMPGVTTEGSLRDGGDGWYHVPLGWDPAITTRPGVSLTQPDRAPVPIAPEAPRSPGSSTRPGCLVWVLGALVAALALVLLLVLLGL